MEENLGINRHLDGCDEYTRPEEIKALSKYLKNIREVRDELLELNEDVLEISPHRPEDVSGLLGTALKLPEIDKLHEPSLHKDREPLLGTKREIPLGKTVLGLEVSPSSPKLGGFTDPMPSSENKSETKLDNVVDPLRVDPSPSSLPSHKEPILNVKDPELGTHKEGLEVPVRETELGKYVDKLKNVRDPELGEKTIGLEVPVQEPELGKTKLGLDIPVREPELGKYVDPLTGVQDPELGEKTIGLEVPVQEPELGKYVDPLLGVQDQELGQVTLGMPGDTSGIENLPDHMETLEPGADPSLGNTTLNIPNYSLHSELGEHVESIYPGNGIEGLPDLTIQKPAGTQGEPNLEVIPLRPTPEEVNKSDYVVPLDPTPEEPDVPNVIIPLSDNENEEGSTIEGLYDGVLALTDTPDLSEDDLFNGAIKLLDNVGGDLADKVSGIMSSYLSGKALSPEGYQEFQVKLRGVEYLANLPAYQLPDMSILDANHPSTFLRKSIEELVDKAGLKGKLRSRAIFEGLIVLTTIRDTTEWNTRSSRGRLPGGNSVLDAAGMAVAGATRGGNEGNLIKGGLEALGALGTPGLTANDLPENRPNKPGSRLSTWKQTPRLTTFRNNSSSQSPFRVADESLLVGGLAKKSKDMGESLNKFGKKHTFAVNYLVGDGIRTTLDELCLRQDSNSIGTVDELFKALRESPFMSVPERFTTTKNGGYSVQTIDSNHSWEIVLEPYTGPENGNFSFLPAIHEINTRNILTHGVNTGYNRWIPITNFELQKNKLQSKSLPLYDGEINFPISMDFINEVRIQIADDQYKSWRRYFESVMEASVYNSEPHGPSYYHDASRSRQLTSIDKSNMCVAMYKNLAFRCVIYSMTPQLSTVRRFDLLLVMRDFITEYIGEIEPGAGDLSISFSIVGENPQGARIPAKNIPMKEVKKPSGRPNPISIIKSNTHKLGLLK